MTTSRTTLHFGSDNQAKTRNLLESVRDSLGRVDSEFLILTPNRYRKLSLIEELSPGARAIFRLPVLTIRELVTSLCRDLDPPLRLLSEFEKRSFLLGLETDARNDSSLGKSAEFSRLLSAIKSQNITDSDLLRLRLTRNKPILTAAEKEIIAIFERYQTELAVNHWEDWEGCYCRVHDGLVTGQTSVTRLFPKARHMLVELPIRLTSIETSIIWLLAADVEETHLLVPVADPKTASALTGWRFLDKVIGLVQIHETLPVRKKVVSHPSLQAELGWIADQVYDCLRLPDSDVRIGIASGSPTQLEQVVRLLEGRGVTTFHEKGGRSDISRLVESLLRYLQLLESRFERLKVFDFLAESRVRSPFTHRQLSSLEELAVRSGVERGIEQWRSRFEPAAGELWQELELPEDAANQLLAVLDDLQLDLSHRSTFRDWYATCSEKLHPLLDFSHLIGGEGEGLNHFREAVRSQSEICRDRALTFTEFASLCRQCSKWPRQRLLHSSPKVLIGAPEEFQNCDLTHFFWIGMTEDVFPVSVADPLSDPEAPQPFRTLSRQDLFDDARLMLQNLERIAPEVRLSFHKRSPDRTTAPSPLLSDIEVTNLDSKDRIEPASPASRENILRGRRIQAIREGLRPSAYSGFVTAPKAQNEFRRILWQDGPIRVSPTALEDYAACGFRFFARRVLRIQAGPSRVSGPTAADLGELIHRILFRFRSQGFVDPWECSAQEELTWLRTQSVRMQQVAEEEIERLRSKFLWGRGLFWEHPERRLLAGLDGQSPTGLLAEFLGHQWKWGRRNQSLGAELRVGPIPVGEIRVGDGTLSPVTLEGRLDRVDRGLDGLVVIDYKTGEDFRSRCYRGWGFQLPLYLMLAQEALQEPVSEAFFLALRLPQKVRAERLRMPRHGQSELWGQLAEFYRVRMLELTKQLHMGCFPPTILSRAQAGCRHCEFREVCRYEGAQASRLRRSRQIFKPLRLFEAGQWTGIFDEHED